MTLWAQIKEDFGVVLEKDPAISSKLELFFNYPGLWALFWHRIAHKLFISNFRVLGRVIMGLSQILTNMDIHPAARIGRRVFIDHGIGVVGLQDGRQALRLGFRLADMLDHGAEALGDQRMLPQHFGIGVLRIQLVRQAVPGFGEEGELVGMRGR